MDATALWIPRQGHAELRPDTAADVLTPFVHDAPAPHIVPAGLLPVAMQTELPVEHEVAPILHGSDGVQATPAVQPTQLPALHTMFVPHVAPLPTAVPVSWQVALPVVQVSVPT